MTTTLRIIAAIFALIAAFLFRVGHSTSSLVFIVLAVLVYIYALFTHRKESKAKKEPNSLGGLKLESYSTDKNTKLVIRSIGTAKNGFINFNEIVNDTNLHLKVINKALDWLVINKFVIVNKGHIDKVYELTPKGRNSFDSIIN